jgi:serine/threonine protein kinase
VCLGKGGFGAVFRGRYRAVDTVAVKRPSGGMSRELADALAQEVSAHYKAQHPHIVHLFGACDDVDNLMIITEHMAGGDLARALRASPEVVGWGARVRALALQVARALNFLHTLEPPILHLDVKPANVLLSADLAVAKLADLGLAKAEMQSQVSVQGYTLAYAAPEVLMRRRGGVTDRADVYSFGILLYEVVTLRSVSMGELSLPARTPSAARALIEDRTHE